MLVDKGRSTGEEYKLIYASKETKEDILTNTTPVALERVKTFGTCSVVSLTLR